MSDLEDECTSEQSAIDRIAEKNWLKVSEQRYNSGVREGASMECDETLQIGFSKGVNTTVQALLGLGKLRGKICALQALCKEEIANTSRSGTLLVRLGFLEQKIKDELYDQTEHLHMDSLSADPSTTLSTKLQNEVKQLFTDIDSFISYSLSSNVKACMES